MSDFSNTCRRTAVSVGTYAVLAAAAAGSFLLPERLTVPATYAFSGPAQVYLNGTVYDFLESHPDFEVVPVGGYGHYAGNVDLVLPADGLPEFAGPGFKVATQWRDSALRPIPPHLYRGPNELAGFQGIGIGQGIFVTQGGTVEGAPGFPLTVKSTNPVMANAVLVTKINSIIDGDVRVAGNPTTQVVTDQGGTITGIVAAGVPPVPSPDLDVPDLGPSVGDQLITSSTVLSSDLHVDTLSIQGGTIVTVSGNRTIVVEDSLLCQNSSQLQLLPGATLEIYVLGNQMSSGAPGIVFFENSAHLNTASADPSLVSVYYLGTNDCHLANISQVCANLYLPDAEMFIGNNTHLWGNFVGKRLNVVQSSIFTVMGEFSGGPNLPVCGSATADSLGAAGVTSTGGITSAATFDQWFQDVLGTNLSGRHAVVLTDNGTGVYEYLTTEFHPIDDRLLGNEGAVHNHYFTFTVDTTFTYEACTGQFFEFEGTDDAWLFIGDQLALDLGGVLPLTAQYVEIDRLDLVDGQEYDFRFFYAQRQGTQAVFRMRTNMLLGSPPPAMVSEGFD